MATKTLRAAAVAKFVAAENRYKAERTIEARDARDEASRELSALTPAPARSRDFSAAARSGRRQHAELRAAAIRAGWRR